MPPRWVSLQTEPDRKAKTFCSRQEARSACIVVYENVDAEVEAQILRVLMDITYVGSAAMAKLATTSARRSHEGLSPSHLDPHCWRG